MDGWSNKYVTIFASSTRIVYMITKTYATQQNILVAGGQHSLKTALITFTVTGKKCTFPPYNVTVY
jgi:hypothetical protein